MLSLTLAVFASAVNAAGNVMQREADAEEPPELGMSIRLVLALLRRPVWLGGMAATIVSFLLMAAALGMGRLAEVQPVLVIELPMTLVAASWVFGSKLDARQWTAAGAMTVGLAGLVGFLDPQAGDAGRTDGLRWGLGAGVTTAVIAILVAGAVLRTQPGSERRRPALLGTAAGLGFGLSAAFMKGMTSAFDHGVIGVISAWQTYAMVAAGAAAMFLMQNAYHSGPLVLAQPGITLADPAIAIAWGILVFGEKTRGGLFLVLAIVSGVVMAAGTVLLSPEGANAPPDQPDRSCTEPSRDRDDALLVGR